MPLHLDLVREQPALSTPSLLRALIVEDRAPDAEILAFHLSKGGYELSYERVDSEAAMRVSLARGDFDIIFCDYVIPGFGAQAAFDLLRQTHAGLPFIVVSAEVDDDGASDLLVAGADDFIAKGHYARLIPAVRRSLAAADERRKSERLRVALELQAQRDALTGLLTRGAFIARIRQALAQASTTPLAVLRLDLLHFGRVSESFGDEPADELLREVTARLAGAVPEGATLARIAGDAFGVITPDDEAAAVRLAARLRATLERSFVVGGQAIHLAGAIGLAVSPAHGTDAATLIRHADAASGRAVRTGHPIAVFRVGEERPGIGIVQVEEFHNALERGELVLHYQPQAERSRVEGSAFKPTGIEALVRWDHPTKGLLPPAAFLPLVRESGLGPALTGWVLAEALSQCRAWWMAGSEVPVAVNLTMEDAQDPTLADRLAELLTTLELPARALEIELTEDTAITDPVAIEETVRRLNTLGARIAIDDFGTGYATLTYLQRLPVHRLKTDRSFVQGLSSRSADAAIVRSAIELGHELGLLVIAEGVEDEVTWQRLRELGCDGIQGYWFARPMPFRDLGRWLVANADETVTGARRAHAATFLTLAEEASVEGVVAERRTERRQDLQRERHNFDLALDGAIGRGDAETALRLGSALRFYWVDQGLAAQGADALRRALALTHTSAVMKVRAAALNALAVLLGQQEDYAGARPLLTEASDIQRRLGDRKGLAASLNNLGMVLDALGQGEAAREAYLDSLAMRRATGDANGEALALANLSTNAYYHRDLVTSRSYAERALGIHRALGDEYGAAVALDTLGAIALDEGDLAGALAAYRASLALYHDLGVTGDATQPMSGIVMIAAAAGASEHALILAGAIAALRDQYPAPSPINAARYERCRTELEAEVSAPLREKALVEGRSLSWDEAVALAREIELERGGRRGA